MINVQGSNKLHDIYRLLWLLCTYAVFTALGYLFCFYTYEQEPVPCNCSHNVTCTSDSLPPVIIRCDMPKTGV